VQAAASRFVTIKVDATETTDEVEKLAEKYDVPGMPTVVFIDAQGREVPERVIGAIEADEMLRRLEAVDGACAKPVPQGALACAARW
jgi:thiol:disulfide interchange protein DsbD